MTEEELFLNACGGALIIILAVVLALIAFGSRPFIYKKKVNGPNTALTVTARKNIARVSLTVKVGGEDVTFERRRVRADQLVEFVYPTSPDRAGLTIELESGRIATFQV